MDAAVAILCWFCFSLVAQTNGVPPDVCFQNFRWEDCGQPPTPVIYYYKSGSRCEVGMWRGCTPNPNMFQDEYECVQTCIFAVRAQPEDFHNQNEVEVYDIDDRTTEGAQANGTETIGNNTTDADAEPTPDGNEPAAEEETATEDDHPDDKADAQPETEPTEEAVAEPEAKDPLPDEGRKRMKNL